MQYFCIFKHKSRQNIQNSSLEKAEMISPKIQLVNIANNVEFTSTKILPESKQLDQYKIRNISQYFQHELKSIISGFNYRKISHKFFVLKLKKYLYKKPLRKQMLNTLKIGGVKPLHLEISYKLLKIIFLYSPQRIYYPFFIDVDLIKRSYNK